MKQVFSFNPISAKTRWAIAGLLAVVALLEFATPPDFVFGYLYIGAILPAASHYRRHTLFGLTFLAVALTLANLWIPGKYAVGTATIANRVIAGLALIVTGFLSAALREADRRNSWYEEAIAASQAQIQAQANLMQVREDFASTLAHDLKTPLLGAVETIRSLVQGRFGNITAPQQQVLKIMERSHRNTLQIVQNLLDIYHNDVNGLTIKQEPVDLVAIAKEAIATLSDLAFARRVTLELEIRAHPSDLQLVGDAFQLQRVLSNLLVNALHHSLRGNQAIVRLEATASLCLVKVIDWGMGIPPEELPRLFERFYQGENERHTVGSGLGLYLSRQIVEAHGGIIWAENRPECGAMFAFQLPRS